jgi:hypothetical protein
MWVIKIYSIWRELSSQLTSKLCRRAVSVLCRTLDCDSRSASFISYARLAKRLHARASCSVKEATDCRGARGIMLWQGVSGGQVNEWGGWWSRIVTTRWIFRLYFVMSAAICNAAWVSGVVTNATNKHLHRPRKTRTAMSCLSPDEGVPYLVLPCLQLGPLTPEPPLFPVSMWRGGRMTENYQRGLTEPKKRVFLKCKLSTCAGTGKL